MCCKAEFKCPDRKFYKQPGEKWRLPTNEAVRLWLSIQIRGWKSLSVGRQQHLLKWFEIRLRSSCFTLFSCPKSSGSPSLIWNWRLSTATDYGGLTQACSQGRSPNEPSQQSSKWQQVATPARRGSSMPFNSYSNRVVIESFKAKELTPKPTFNKQWFLFYALYFEWYIFWNENTNIFKTTWKHISNLCL